MWCSTTFDYTHGPKISKHATLLFLSFCYAPKLPSPFFLYIPTKNPLSMIKYKLTIEFLSANGKNRPTHKPRYRASAKISFIIAIQPFYGCQRNTRKKCKNITITVSVRVSATIRVSLAVMLKYAGESNFMCIFNYIVIISVTPLGKRTSRKTACNRRPHCQRRLHTLARPQFSWI